MPGSIFGIRGGLANLRPQATAGRSSTASVRRAEMPAIWAVAGAGQGVTAFADAARAKAEIHATMRKLTVTRV